MGLHGAGARDRRRQECREREDGPLRMTRFSMANQSRLALATDIPFRARNGGQSPQACHNSAGSSRKDDKDKKT